jgi:hypothetical protein
MVYSTIVTIVAFQVYWCKEKVMEQVMLRAFHGKQKIKDYYAQRVRAHRLADEIRHGYYWEYGKGCAVGCTLHSNDHAAYETELGIPRILARLEDGIFEELPTPEDTAWPQAFLEVIPVGADLSLVWPRFFLRLATDATYGLLCFVQGARFIQQREVIGKVVALYQQWVDEAVKPSTAAASDAAAAAAAAAAADAAAYAAAAAAAYAAAADAYAAADAATAADAAAYAAATATASAVAAASAAASAAATAATYADAAAYAAATDAAAAAYAAAAAAAYAAAADAYAAATATASAADAAAAAYAAAADAYAVVRSRCCIWQGETLLQLLREAPVLEGVAE